jgi:predicted amidohydrolase
VRDCVFKGAELVIRIQGYMHPCNVQQRVISQVRAFESNTYFAVANMAGESQVCTASTKPCTDLGLAQGPALWHNYGHGVDVLSYRP